MQPRCQTCGELIRPVQRHALGYTTCMPCGDKAAKLVPHIVQIPFSKGAYQFIYNPDDLKITNPKRINDNPKTN